MKAKPMICDRRNILLKITATTLSKSNSYPCSETMLRMYYDSELISQEIIGMTEQVSDQVTK